MLIGSSLPRREGADKVTGRTRYVDDLSFPGMIYGATVRSSRCHARIRSIRFDDSFDWSDIVMVDARDIPGDNVVALIVDDQPYLASARVRHKQEAVVLLACADRTRLREAVTRVRIDYEDLPAVLTASDSLTGRVCLRAPDNIYKEIVIEKGDTARALAESDCVVEGHYRVGPQEQLYIEPQGMIALPDPGGTMTILGSMQCPYYVHRAVKRMLGCADSAVAVVFMTTGGGFGGKEEYPSMVAGHAALLARKAGRPVKMIYDREEDLRATTKRHPGAVRHKTGVTKEGRLCAMEIEVLLDGGAYCTLSPVVLSRAVIHATGPYRCDNVRIVGRVVATSNPPYGAFRGFGVPQVCFAVERQLDKVASALGLAPLDVRRRNVLRRGDLTATGQRLTSSVAAAEVLEEAVRLSGYESKWARSRKGAGALYKGVGLSLFFHGAGFTGSGEDKIQGRAGLELLPAGRVRVLAAATEIGQGTQTVLTQIVAEELGIDPGLVEIENPSTARVPDSGPTVASRTCMVVGGVLQQAARKLRQQLEGRRGGDSQKDAGWAELADRYLRQTGPLRVYEQYRRPPELTWDEENYRGDAYAAYSWAADVAEVEVDLTTYETRVTRLTTCHEVGKVIHPQMAEGQIEGGTLQALGYALCEEVRMVEGEMANARLTNYIIPTAMDVPHIETHLLEAEFEHGPYGAKGLGELPMDGAAPAVAAAIENATGVFLAELPMLPERLFEAIQQ